MLYHLLYPLRDFFFAFNIFQYISFRAVGAALTALFISFLLGPFVIKILSRLQVGEIIRHSGPESHQIKEGTPTMGGALILVAIIISALLWGDLSNRYIWITIVVTAIFGIVGWIDDYRKVIEKNSRGLIARWKYFWQSVGGLGAALFLFYTAQGPEELDLIVPFFKDVSIHLGLLYILFTYFVIVGTSNAVNLTDGLDGLAILPTVLVAAALGVFAYLTGHAVFSEYLHIPYIRGSGELVVFCAAMVGAGMGFLWFNTYPAQVFMGDVGSLALGAALGIIAILVRQELVLFIMGGVFVMETVSVMLQVGSYKLRGKRVFRMAPIHHHYELKGWPEPRVIVRFWILSLIFVLIGLATLKLR